MTQPIPRIRGDEHYPFWTSLFVVLALIAIVTFCAADDMPPLLLSEPEIQSIESLPEPNLGVKAVATETITGLSEFDRDKMKFLRIASPAPKTAYSWLFYPVGAERNVIEARRLDRRGLEVMFDGPPGEYDVEILAITATSDPEFPSVPSRTTKRFKIVDRFNPQPGPFNPNPPGPLGPDAGRFGLAKITADTLASHQLDKPTASSVAATLGNVAKEIRESKFPTPQDAIFAVRDRNRALLTQLGKLQQWQGVLNALAQSVGGKVGANPQPNDLADAFGEVQSGLLWFATH